MATNISTININNTPEKIWAVLTKPELVKQWQYGSKLETSWEPGSSIRFITEWEDKVFQQWGTVLEFTPYEKLSYSLFAPRPGLEDKPENYFEMIYKLTTVSAGTTLLEIIQEDNRPGARQEDPQNEENPILKMLKDIAEANN